MRWWWFVLAAGCTQAAPEDAVVSDMLCSVGERRDCECGPGEWGESVCASSDGRWTECGCESSDPSVYVPPPPPVIERCPSADAESSVVCAPYLEPETTYSATHCCTSAGECGSTNFLLMGFECVARREPAEPSARCPDESITFIDLRGCCLPDGQCGLTLDDTLPNWDLGCVERTEMRRIIDQGFGRKIVAGLMGLDPEVPLWSPLQCAD